MVGFVVQRGQAGQSGPPPASIQEGLIFRGRGSSCQVGTESRVAMGKKQTAPLGKTEILSRQASFPVFLIRTRQASFSLSLPFCLQDRYPCLILPGEWHMARRGWKPKGGVGHSRTGSRAVLGATIPFVCPGGPVQSPGGEEQGSVK